VIIAAVVVAVDSQKMGKGFGGPKHSHNLKDEEKKKKRKGKERKGRC